jgi:hypothetical protein
MVGFLLLVETEDYRLPGHLSFPGPGVLHLLYECALLKTSIALPIVDGELVLGTWQQIVVINLDNRAREREVVSIVLGS